VTAAGEPLRVGAVVLTGGTARRMGGADKAALQVDGVSLLERSLAATVSAREVVVVGAEVATSRPVTWTAEEPPSGGPAAAVLAGLDALRLDPELVVVLAVDMPRVTAATVARLVWAAEADPTVDGAVLLDREGRRQPLAASYRRTALVAARPARPGLEHGLPMRRLVGALRLADVPAVGDEGMDVDTWADLRAFGGS
jgi:molybdopterin-guanine dinucleotide biosynthesis protein A